LKNPVAYPVAGLEFGIEPPRAITYCLAHHVTVGGTKRRLMVASPRYLDTLEDRAGGFLARNGSMWTGSVAHTLMTAADH